MALEFNDDNFQKEVIESNQPVLVDFWAPWCGPCQAMGPIIDEFSKEVEGKIKVGKVNVDESPLTAQKYSIMSIPSLMIFKGGKVYKQLTPGIHSKEDLLEETNSLE